MAHWDEVVSAGGLAVVTGGASGVGFAAAKHLASLGFELLLVDVDGAALWRADETLRGLGATVEIQVLDVADAHAFTGFAERTLRKSSVAVLMNNAGIDLPTGAWNEPAHWRRLFDVNFFGILNGMQGFVPGMLEAGRPAAVINTGSKQGITTPPGNPGYNATKAAVKVVTEQLAHELREAGAPISAHLFVPGFTWTGITMRGRTDKPDAAWTSEQTVEHLFERVASGDFYILCPDNDVTPEMDAKRVRWAAGDVAENRPALSRWHPEHAAAFDAS